VRPLQDQPDRDGNAGIRFHDLRDLLAEYGVSEGERAGLMALAGSRGFGGWDAYADVLPRTRTPYPPGSGPSWAPISRNSSW
jgi:hypothetical protein